MFTPNTKLMKIDFNVNPDDCVDSAVLCWSPTLGCDVWLSAETITEDYTMEATSERPKPYSGGSSITQDWMILRNKNGDEKQSFWTGADQFEFESSECLSFIDANGLDIDPESVTFSYDDQIYYVDSEDNTFSIGTVDSLEEGKITLYSAVESEEATDADDDGDDVYATIPQEKFEAIRQLCIQGGFKVKVKRIKH